MQRRMRVRLILTAAALAVGLTGWMVATGTAAQGRVPLFEPDPLWSQALPEQVGDRAGRRRRRRFARQRLGVPSPRHHPRRREGRRRSIRRRPSAAFRRPPCSSSTRTGSSFRRGAAPGSGYEWFTLAARHLRRRQGQRLAERQREGRQPDPEVHEQGQVPDADRPLPARTRAATTPRTSEGRRGCSSTRRPTSCSSPTATSTTASSCSTRTTGAYKRHWGAYGKKPDDSLTVPAARAADSGAAAAGFNNPVHAVLVSNDDLVYVADRTNNRLQVFRLDGTFVKEAFIARNTLQAEGTVHAFAVSPDKEQQFLYVVDGSNKAIRVLNRQTLEMLSIDRRARRAQRARVLPHPQLRGRLEGQPVHRRSEQRPALLQVRLQGFPVGGRRSVRQSKRRKSEYVAKATTTSALLRRGLS